MPGVAETKKSIAKTHSETEGEGNLSIIFTFLVILFRSRIAKVSLVLRDTLRWRKPAKALSSHSFGALGGVASWEWSGEQEGGRGSTSSEDKFKKLAAENQKSCLQGKNMRNPLDVGGAGAGAGQLDTRHSCLQ